MTTRARRITIEVGGEDTGASKTLRGAGDGLDTLGRKLRGVNADAQRGFAGVEGEADKLASKMKTYGSKIGDNLSRGIDSGTSKIGSTMESAGSAAGDAFSSGFDVNTIADTVASGFGSLSGKIGTAAAGAGVAAAAAFTAGLMNGFETEAATDRLAAQLGGSQWAQDQGEVAGNLYLQGFGESVADTASAVREVLQNHLVPEDAGQAEIEELTGRFLTFTDVLEQDMDMATQAVSNMIRTGIAEDGTEALDILSRGIQQGADRAGDLLETFQEYSTMFRDLGISAEDATGLMVQGLQAGARDADTVADALKEFAIRAQDASETSAAGFEAIGLNAEAMTAKVAAGGPLAREALDQVLNGLQDMEDPVARNAAAVALFGTKAEDLGDALFNLDLDTAADRLGNVEGATDDLGSAYDNASSKIETFRRQALEKLTVFVADEVIPVLQDFGRWAQENPGKVTAAAVALGTLTAAFVAAKLALAAWTVATTAWTVVTGIATAAQWAFNAAFYASPIGWIILAIIGLIAIIVLLVVHWDTVAKAAGAAWDWIWSKATAVWQWVKTNWPTLLALLGGLFGLAALAIVRNWDTIREKAGQALQWIKDRATGMKNWTVDQFNAVVSFVAGLPGRISSAASGMWDGITDSFRAAINSIISLWNGLQFPSVTVGGGDPLGSFGPSLPRVTIGGWDLPNIPMLAEGGIVRASPGGTLIRAGEGRHDEAVVPLDGNHGSGGDTYNINVSFAGAIVSSEADAERWVTKALDRAIAKGNGPTNRGRRIG